MKQVDEGFFLSKSAYSETSVVGNFFTLGHGFITLFFPGGKKRNTQFFPMHSYHLEYYKRPDSELGKLVKMELDHDTSLGISTDPIKSALAFFMAELSLKCLRNSDKDAELFRFLKTSLVVLRDGEDLAHFPLQFMADLTYFLGFGADADVLNPKSFSLIDGTFSVELIGKDIISGKEVEYLKKLFAQETIVITRRERQDLLQILIRYYQFHWEGFSNLKSVEVLQEILA